METEGGRWRGDVGEKRNEKKMAWGEACPAAEEEENHEGGVRGCLCFAVVVFLFF